MTNPEEGWYPDPDGGPLLRYWDGTQWTDSYHDPVAADTGGQPPTGWTAGGGASVYDEDPYAQGYGGYEYDDRFMGPAGPAPWLIPAALAAVAALVIVGFLLLRGGGDDDVAANGDATATVDPSATTEPTTEADDTGGADTGETDTTGQADATPTTEPGSATDEREATLLVDFARLRAEPSLSAAAVSTIEGQADSPVTVIGPAEDGWYNIKIGGLEGWMFGAFIHPADAGLEVVVANNGQPLTLRNASGEDLKVVNASGAYALVTDSSDATLWQVILADGSNAYVNAADVSPVS